MNRLVVPMVYTIVSFGASISLWRYLPSVTLLPSMEGIPFGLIHPYFIAELFFMLSTVVVWVMAMLISLYKIRRQRVALTKSIVQNWLVVSLVFATVISAIFGCIFYLEPFHFKWCPLGDLCANGSPNPYALANAVGILFCEAAWTIIGVAKIATKVREMRQKKKYKWARGDLNTRPTGLSTYWCL